MYVNSSQTINMPETPCVSWFERRHVNRLIVFAKIFIKMQNSFMTIREIQLIWRWVQLSLL